MTGVQTCALPISIVVGRDRFLPVKATSDLLLVRSDAYDLDDRRALVQRVETVPTVSLDAEHYKLIGDFDERFPAGVPSIREARLLSVEGDHVFGAGVIARGEARVTAEDPREIPDGTVIEG